MALKSGSKSLRAAIRDTIECEIPSFATVSTHGGKLTQADLENYAHRLPALLVTVNGHGEIGHEGGQRYAIANIECWILTKDTPQLRRDEAALDFADLVIKEAVLNAWGFTCGIQRPFNMKSRNHFHPKLDECGVNLWVIAWTQKIDLELVDVATLDAFEDVQADYPISETTDDTQDLIVLEQP